MALYCIGADSPKRLILQMLLYPFERIAHFFIEPQEDVRSLWQPGSSSMQETFEVWKTKRILGRLDVLTQPIRKPHFISPGVITKDEIGSSILQTLNKNYGIF